jgi:hypothetical protein
MPSNLFESGVVASLAGATRKRRTAEEGATPLIPEGWDFVFNFGTVIAYDAVPLPDKRNPRTPRI